MFDIYVSGFLLPGRHVLPRLKIAFLRPIIEDSNNISYDMHT